MKMNEAYKKYQIKYYDKHESKQYFYFIENLSQKT